MYLYVKLAKSKEGKLYIVLEARTEWGTTSITFDKGTIAQILPKGLSLADIVENGANSGYLIGEIYEYGKA